MGYNASKCSKHLTTSYYKNKMSYSLTTKMFTYRVQGWWQKSVPSSRLEMILIYCFVTYSVQTINLINQYFLVLLCQLFSVYVFFSCFRNNKLMVVTGYTTLLLGCYHFPIVLIFMILYKQSLTDRPFRGQRSPL